MLCVKLTHDGACINTGRAVKLLHSKVVLNSMNGEVGKANQNTKEQSYREDPDKPGSHLIPI